MSKSFSKNKSSQSKSRGKLQTSKKAGAKKSASNVLGKRSVSGALALEASRSSGFSTAVPLVSHAPFLMHKPAVIPQQQWDLPAGLKPDGTFATLAEVLTDPIPTLSLETLSEEQKQNLVLERIRRQENYPTRYMLGVGEVNRERAIAEVQAKTPAGKFIQESEQKLIQLLQKAAFK